MIDEVKDATRSIPQRNSEEAEKSFTKTTCNIGDETDLNAM